jgi:CBS-domain-containing membrane protein
MREGDSWEGAALSLRKAGISTAPVVDSDGYLVAILNPSDLLQEMEIEVCMQPLHCVPTVLCSTSVCMQPLHCVPIDCI